ncbi:MAG: MarR family transcriptional regulator [Muribaculaceae bacterium]|nr:MarR family transcriptional regulator [Muribaculaceae bacterium]
MNDEKNIYAMPNLGCMTGTAYHILEGQLAEALRGAGLDISTPEYLVLRALRNRDGMQQCELGEVIGKDKSAISRTVSGMARRGLVATEQVSHKCQRVWLTDSARAIMPDVLRVAAERHKALTDMCTPEELEAFSAVLKKIINN